MRMDIALSHSVVHPQPLESNYYLWPLGEKNTIMILRKVTTTTNI